LRRSNKTNSSARDKLNFEAYWLILQSAMANFAGHVKFLKYSSKLCGIYLQ